MSLSRMFLSRMFLVAAISSLCIMGASANAAEQDNEPPMHMHKSQMTHNKPDKETAADYKDEAAALAEKAQSHRNWSSIFKRRLRQLLIHQHLTLLQPIHRLPLQLYRAAWFWWEPVIFQFAAALRMN